MERGGDPGRKRVVRPRTPAFIHTAEDGGERSGWDDQGEGDHSDVQRDPRDTEEVLGEEILGSWVFCQYSRCE